MVCGDEVQHFQVLKSSTSEGARALEYRLSPQKSTISGALLAWPSPSRIGIPGQWLGDLDVQVRDQVQGKARK